MRKNPHLDIRSPGADPDGFTRRGGIAAHEALCWRHVRRIREPWKGPLIITGILLPADAEVARGCETTEGGSSITLCRRWNSGFRRRHRCRQGVGASVPSRGRPFLFAVAFADRSGVVRAITLLTREVDLVARETH